MCRFSFSSVLFPSNNISQHLSFTIWGSARDTPTRLYRVQWPKQTVANASPAPKLPVPASWLTAPGPQARLQSPAGGTFLEEMFSSKVNMFHFCTSVLSHHPLLPSWCFTFFTFFCHDTCVHQNTQSGESTQAQPTSSAPDEGREHASPTRVSLGSFLSLPPCTRVTAPLVFESSDYVPVLNRTWMESCGVHSTFGTLACGWSVLCQPGELVSCVSHPSCWVWL